MLRITLTEYFSRKIKLFAETSKEKTELKQELMEAIISNWFRNENIKQLQLVFVISKL